MIKQLFNPVDVRQPVDRTAHPDNRGGLYHNLLDACPPFQIDGNFGGPAGITEMLLQSHSDAIHLLPALPQVWNRGELKGFRAKGGFEIDMAWEKGKITSLRIKSTIGGNCRIRVNHPLKETSRLKAAKGENPNLLFDKRGFAEPLVSEELTEGARPMVVKDVFEYDISTEKGKVIRVAI